MKEKFLVLDIAPKRTSGLYLSVDEDRNIIFEKTAHNIDLAKLAKSVFQKTWEGKHIFNEARRKVIAVADPALATTIPIPVELARDHGYTKSRLTVAELENLIAQAMAKIFNGCRGEAARRLKLADLDAILVGAKGKYFKIDGKPVVTPVGFAGKKVTLLLELTFTGRALFEDMKQFFSSPDDFFFAEAPQAHLFSLARVRDLPLSLLVAEEDGMSLFVLQSAKDDYAVLYREKLSWSFGSLIRSIAETLAVTDEAAKGLYCAYHRGEVSESAGRVFKKIVQPALDKFFKEIERAGVRGAVYLDAPHALPLALPHKHGAARIEEHPLGDLIAELGFTVDPAAFHEGKDHTRRALIYFLEAYFDRSNSEINQKLRRRLHWLVT